jgi:WD40 repeat protein
MVAIAASVVVSCRSTTVEDAVAISRPPRISPDCSGTTIPPNIAPLNFIVHEPGRRFHVRIASQRGSIEIASRSPKITIPEHRWHALIEANRGNDLQWDICAEVDGGWQSYQTIINHVAEHPIDGHLVYRLTGPIHEWWGQITVQQRDLTTYDRSVVMDGASFDFGCVNCHSFANNRPTPMLIGMRSSRFDNATILARAGQTKKVASPFGYTAWHPSGRLAAYSINKVRQFYHAAGPHVRDVVDLDAALGYYMLDADTLEIIPNASDKGRLESYPTWSPDGRYLYYCSAPILWEDRDVTPPPRYDEVRYDLMRISYDIDTDTWGDPELLLSSDETGLSILQPRISPDGKYVLFCMCRYGCFPVYQPSSDLHMMNLDTNEYSKLDINSPQSESWHSWSSNSHWIAFSSRRRGGTFTRCYLSYIDKSGNAHKPFILPRADPESYDSLLKSISVPELVTGPVPFTTERLGQIARSTDASNIDAVTSPTPLSGASEPWKQAGH